jgi:predicted secreted hydrolase
MKFKVKEIDVIIIIALIVISGLVLIRMEIVPPPFEEEAPSITFFQDDADKKLIVLETSKDVLWRDIEINGNCDITGLGKYVVEGDEITQCEGTVTISYKPDETKEDILGSWTFTPKEVLPQTLQTPEERVVTPKDEGEHYKGTIGVKEWWYYTVIFDQDSELPGWTLTVSFNHMSRLDLFATKPDILFVSLCDPDGNKYGGKVEKERPWLGEYGLTDPALQADSSDNGFRVSFDKSYIQGKEPSWHLHIESDELDEKHDIKIDLQYNSVSSPYWTYNKRLVDNSKAKIASYVFLGCKVTGTIEIDGFEYSAKGIGHYEHTWASGIITKYLIKGWDWYQINCKNGWNIYYRNYYLTHQLQSTDESLFNPLASLIVTTDQGDTLTILEDVDIEILQSDKIFTLGYIPTETQITAQASSKQLIIRDANIKLNLNIKENIVFDYIWKNLVRVGIKIGNANVEGSITWNDNYGDHNVALEGIGTIWNMRH